MTEREYVDYLQVHENNLSTEAVMEEIASTVLLTTNNLMDLVDTNLSAIAIAPNSSSEVVESNISEISVNPALSLDNVHADTSVDGDELAVIDGIINADSNEMSNNVVLVSSYAIEEEPYSDTFASSSLHEGIHNVHSTNNWRTASNFRTSPIQFVDLTEDEPPESTILNTFIDSDVKNVWLNILLDVLPDADFVFLKHKADTILSDEELNLFVSNALEHRNYPTKYTGQETEKIISSTLISDDKIADGNSDSTMNIARPIDTVRPNMLPALYNLAYTAPSPVQSDFPKINDPTSQHVAVTYTVGQPVYSAPQVSYVMNQATKPHTVTSSESFQSVASHSTFLTVTTGHHNEIPVPASQSTTVVPVTDNVTRVDIGTATHSVDMAQPDSTTSTNEFLREFPVAQMNIQPPYLTPPIFTIQQLGMPPVYNNKKKHGTARIGKNNFPNLIDMHRNLQQNVIPRHERLPNDIPMRNPIDPIDGMLHELRNIRYAERFPRVPINNIHQHVADVRHLVRNLQRNAGGREHRNHVIHARQRLLMDGLLDVATVVNNEGTDVVGPPKTAEEERYTLLCDILYAADRALLRDEAKTLKSDEDVDKYLIHAFSFERTWKNGIPVHGLQLDKSLQSPTLKQNDYKYKVLLELLPDASPLFLKRESLKLATDEDLHKFALKLSREQLYPKRKNSGAAKSKRKSSEFLENQSQDIVDPKFQTLREMLPDADPDFLLEQCQVLNSSTDIEAFVLKSVEEKNYPKRDEFLKRQEFRKQWNKYMENFDMKEFLQLFPNPIRYFYIEKVNSKNPLDIPVKFLQHRYCRKHSNMFGNIYVKTKQNLTKTCDRLDIYYPGQKRTYAVWNTKTIFPTSVLQEIAFIQNKTKIAHYLLFKDMKKLEAVEKAKATGMLQECGCCYEEKLPDDMATCRDGHVFCVICIKRGSEVVVGGGGCSFPCYSDGCKEEFSLEVVKTVLNPEAFSRMLTRKQYEEVNAAGISGLETCSFCEFCSIPPSEDKLFHCLNPLCMKVTCRSCKRLDHLPLTCQEFTEKNTQLKMQSYVEDKMTEALVRTCWQCGTKFVKESGCNMMQCKCGAKMCYLCRQPINNYNHFNRNRCDQTHDTTAHDEATVLKVGKEAKEEMEAANPGIHLENDPTELLKSKKQRRH